MLVAHIAQTKPYTSLALGSSVSNCTSANSSSSPSISSTKSTIDHVLAATSSISSNTGITSTMNNKHEDITTTKNTSIQSYSFGLLRNVIYASPPTASAVKVNNNTPTTSTKSYLQSYTSAPASMLKSLTVHLNRGTESIKTTVQKALFSAVNVRNRTESKSIPNKDKIVNNMNNKPTSTTNPDTDKHYVQSSIKKEILVNATDVEIKVSAKNSNQKPKVKTPVQENRGAEKLKKNYAETSISNPVITLALLNSLPDIHNNHLQRATRESRQQTDSADSFHNEMCHFKPIRPAPCTPWYGSKNHSQDRLMLNPMVKRVQDTEDSTPKKIEETTTTTNKREQVKKLKPSALSQTLLRRQRTAPNRRRHRSAFAIAKDLSSTMNANSSALVRNKSTISLRSQHNTRSKASTAIGNSNVLPDGKRVPARGGLSANQSSKSKTIVTEEVSPASEICKPYAPMVNLNRLKMAYDRRQNLKPKNRKSRFCISSNKDMRRFRKLTQILKDSNYNLTVRKPTGAGKLCNREQQCGGVGPTSSNEMNNNISFTRKSGGSSAYKANTRTMKWNTSKKGKKTKSTMINIVQLARETNAALRKATIDPEENTSQHILAVTKPMTIKESMGYSGVNSAYPSSTTLSVRRKRKANCPTSCNSSASDFNFPVEDLREVKRRADQSKMTLIADWHLVNTATTSAAAAYRHSNAISTTNFPNVNFTASKRDLKIESKRKQDKSKAKSSNEDYGLPTFEAINAIQKHVFTSKSPMTRSQYRKLASGRLDPPVFSPKIHYLK